MNKPELLGLEVNTPDGRGYILALHNAGVAVVLNAISRGQKMKGRMYRETETHYFYPYEDVEIIKGKHNFINPS